MSALDPLIGQVIDGRYRIEAVIGEGAMGIVYRAVHGSIDKRVAIKVLRREISRNDQIVARFKQEAQMASRIGNEHIVDISDFGELRDGSTYFAMELLNGRPLSQALREESFDVSRTVHIGIQLCSALGAAHAAGIVHRDLKPDNVQLVTRGGDADFVKLLDFGIAKVLGASRVLTQAGQVFGTPHYMSPEQCAGSAVDDRTDIYSVGVILYELATGRVPFDAPNVLGILQRQLYDAPRPPRAYAPGLPRQLEETILRCLTKAPEHRFASMPDLQRALEAVDCEPPHARRGTLALDDLDDDGEASFPALQTRARRKHRGAWLLGVGALLGLGVLLAQSGRLRERFAGSHADDTAAIVMPAPVETASPQAMEASQPSAESTPTPRPVDTLDHARDDRPPPPPDDLATQQPPPLPQEEPAAPEPPQLRVETSPRGAALFIDGSELGTTPMTVPRPAPGTQLLLRLAGYKDARIELSDTSGGPLQIDMQRLKPPAGHAARTRPRPAPQPPAPEVRPSTPDASQPRGDDDEILDPWG